MNIEFPVLASGFAKPLSDTRLLTDSGLELLTDTGYSILANYPEELRYTNPDLHRRIDEDADIPPKSTHEYVFIAYDANGNPYKQIVNVGILDGMNSYRVMENFIHDEESTTCEIP